MAKTPESPAGQPIRVLVVDDAPTFVEALCGFLTRWSALTVVAVAEDGCAALEQFADQRPDLVIMDVAMPRMGGLAAAAAMRRLAPDARIILVSIHHDPLMQADSARHGADRFVPKIGIQRQLGREIESLFPQLQSKRTSA